MTRGTGGVPLTTAAGAARDGQGSVFADDSGATISAGFGTGLAGTGAFLLRLVAGGPRPLLLDDLFTHNGSDR